MTFAEWLKTDHGKESMTYPVTDIKYLHNRLWWAFEAGVESGELDRRLQETLQWYESKIKEMKVEIKGMKATLKKYADNENNGI
jgi:hypothetical protein